MNHDLPLMLVPLIVWIAVWGYLWTLEGKVKRLQQQFRDTSSDDDEAWPPAPAELVETKREL